MDRIQLIWDYLTDTRELSELEALVDASPGPERAALVNAAKAHAQTINDQRTSAASAEQARIDGVQP